MNTPSISRIDIRKAIRPILLAVAGLLVVNTAFYLLLVRPKGRELGALQAESDPRFTALEDRRAQVEDAEAFVDALAQAEVDLASLREDVLSTRERRMVDVQLELAKICEQFRIDLDTVAYENDILGPEGLERFRMIVPLQGGYAELRRFLQAVESSDKFLIIERVRLGAGLEGPGSAGGLLLNITLDTYFNAPVELLDRAASARRG